MPSRTQRPAATAEVTVAGVTFALDCRGALYWPEERILAVADLHLEKGSSFAARGVLLPPYDTAETLGSNCRPCCPLRAAHGDRARRQLPRRQGAGARRRERPHDACRTSARARLDLDHRQSRSRSSPWYRRHLRATLAVGAVVFRHEPTGAKGEIAGHLHPVARVGARGRSVSRRCFASDGTRLVMPAFGAYAGGLNVRHRAFADVFGTLCFHRAHAGRGTTLFACRRPLRGGLNASFMLPRAGRRRCKTRPADRRDGESPGPRQEPPPVPTPYS